MQQESETELSPREIDYQIAARLYPEDRSGDRLGKVLSQSDVSYAWFDSLSEAEYKQQLYHYINEIYKEIQIEEYQAMQREREQDGFELG